MEVLEDLINEGFVKIHSLGVLDTYAKGYERVAYHTKSERILFWYKDLVKVEK